MGAFGSFSFLAILGFFIPLLFLLDELDELGSAFFVGGLTTLPPISTSESVPKLPKMPILPEVL